MQRFLGRYNWRQDFIRTAPLWAAYCVAACVAWGSLWLWSTMSATAGSMSALPALLLLLPLWYPAVYLFWVNLVAVPLYLWVVRPGRSKVMLAAALLILTLIPAIVGFRWLAG